MCTKGKEGRKEGFLTCIHPKQPPGTAPKQRKEHHYLRNRVLTSAWFISSASRGINTGTLAAITGSGPAALEISPHDHMALLQIFGRSALLRTPRSTTIAKINTLHHRQQRIPHPPNYAHPPHHMQSHTQADEGKRTRKLLSVLHEKHGDA
jgi:hypothetical protein